MRSQNMIKIILTYLAAITIFCNVHDAKICYEVHRRNTSSNVLFIEKNAHHKLRYHLKAKKFVNFREIQLQRIKDYRKRSGPDKNNINYNVKDAYNYHDNFLFVRNEVFPTLAKIENEKVKEREKYRTLFRNINDYNTSFNRRSFMQFLIDLYNIFLKIDELFLIYKEDFSLLTYTGPMLLTNHLYDDIVYLTSVVENCDDVTVSPYGREYISHLEELSQKNKISTSLPFGNFPLTEFLAHAYLFYKNFHLNKEHLLNSICKYLNIIKKLKSSKYVPDVANFEEKENGQIISQQNAAEEVYIEFCLNKMSRKWSRWDKDNFLSGLHDATDKMMILTKHFQQTKE